MICLNTNCGKAKKETHSANLSQNHLAHLLIKSDRALQDVFSTLTTNVKKEKIK